MIEAFITVAVQSSVGWSLPHASRGWSRRRGWLSVSDLAGLIIIVLNRDGIYYRRSIMITITLKF